MTIERIESNSEYMNHYTLSVEDISVKLNEEKIKSLINSSESSMIIGQPRAVKALEMGTEIKGKGYNIFVTGISGTGRITAIKKILNNHSGSTSDLKDIVYVYNFKTPDSPMVLYLNKGEGSHFKKSIHTLVEDLKKSITGILSKRIYSGTRDEYISDFERTENRILSEFEQKLKENSFQIVKVSEDDEETTDIHPIWRGKTVSFDQLLEFVREGTVDEDYWNEQRKHYYSYMEEMRHLFIDINDLQLELEKKLQQLRIKTVKPEIERLFRKIKENYAEDKVITYLTDFEEDVIQNLFIFTGNQEEEEEGDNPTDLLRYGVNIIVDHSRSEKVPVIYENHPRYTNLFGSIETKIDLNGESRTNFLMIRAGSLIQASGGFIILKAEDVLKEEGTWENLKKALQTEEVEIQIQSNAFNLQNNSIKPSPIKINTKILMVGNENLYEILYNNDRDFQKFFKISAEFDSEMDLNDDNIKQYIGFMNMIVEDEKLSAPDITGIIEIISYGIRLAEHKRKLSTRFSLIADLLREASYWAQKDHEGVVTGKSVKKTLRMRDYLHNLPEEKLVEFIDSGDILLSVSGESAGRINGLAVHDRGFYSFGSPLVISVQVSPGSEGLVNIEREVGLSGDIHDKGVFIIEGYLRKKYARDFPLSFFASICFEQSYGEVDGDSASSTEIYALLSAIADIPIKQSIAVTGSVNQMGQVQPVGGITEKITGFHTICKRLGFTGDQGVIIPHQNIVNLTLPDEICTDIKEKRFFIYPIKTIDEGMEILTGMTAGERNKKGNFPAHTINNLVESRLKEIAHLIKNYS